MTKMRCIICGKPTSLVVLCEEHEKEQIESLERMTPEELDAEHGILLPGLHESQPTESDDN